MTARARAGRLAGRVVRTSLAVAGACLWAAPPGFAQTSGGRPLFGGDVRSSARRPLVDFTVSLSGARDDDLAADQGATASPAQGQIGGLYQDFDGSMSFAVPHRHVTVAAHATTTLRRYPVLDDFVASSYSAGFALAANWGARTTIQTSLDTNHVSNFAFDTFSRRTGADQRPLLSPEAKDASVDWTSRSSGATASLTRTVGRRSSLVVSSGLRYSERPIVGEHDKAYTVGASVGRSVGPHMALRVGYAYRRGLQVLARDTREASSHDGQIVVEREWRHSPSRRTVASLSSGLSLLQEDAALPAGGAAPPDDAAAQGPGTGRAGLVRVVGLAALDHQMSRGWTLRTTYRRGAGLRDAKVFSNTATLEMLGGIGRRIDVTMSAGYSDGEIGIEAVDNRFGTSFGSARIRLALSRYVAAYGQFYRYRYDFGRSATLPAGSPTELNRSGVRAGITLWAPLHRGS